MTTYHHHYSKGYLEFDIENIFANRDELEFNVLYNTIHRNNFILDSEENISIIEKFQKESITEGVKIGDNLRDNVHDALELLGDELIQQNSKFYDKILENSFNIQKYYAELLRIIYRMIFLLYAEQREMLPKTDSIYFEEFSLSSLRYLSERPIKTQKHYDLWNKLFLTFKLVDKGNALLDVNCFNGSLFNDNFIPIIINNNLKVCNDVLLNIIRLLTTSKNYNVLQKINFLEISEEEIGAIYESLLDYKPEIDNNSHFQLVQGDDRKSTGSYYTPKSVVDLLIKSTLESTINEIESSDIKSDHKLDKLKEIKICDPACGGGTFLLSAMDLLGRKIAEINTEIEINSEENLREARREVLQKCIYGVDRNPLAVELSKVSLWLRASVNDKPLNFLDNHIKNGNSLIGLEAYGKDLMIQPENFKAPNKANKDLKPDYKKLKNHIKKEVALKSKSEKKVMHITSFTSGKEDLISDLDKFQKLLQMDETDIKDFKKKEVEYKRLRKRKNFLKLLNVSNSNIATYFWPIKEESLNNYPNNTILDEFKEGIINAKSKEILKKANQIAQINYFFHWFLEFPEVFRRKRRGFDIIITNPPYISSKEINIEEKHYYKKSFQSAVRQYDLYSLFLERCYRLLKKGGRMGLIIPDSFLGRSSFEFIRSFLLINTTIKKIIQINNVFADASVANIIIILQKINPNEENQLSFSRYADLEDFRNNLGENVSIPQRFLLELPKSRILFLNENVREILEKIRMNSFLFGDIIDAHRGEEMGRTSKLIEDLPTSTNKKLIRGEDVKRYKIDFSEKYLPLEKVKKKDLYPSPKILMRQLGDSINAMVDMNDNFITIQSIYNIKLIDEDYNYYSILGVLNSQLMNFYFTIMYKEKDLFPRILLENIKNLPIPLYLRENQEGISERVQELIQNEQNEDLENEIDEIIFDLYNLNVDEIEYVRNFIT
ncbi:MAG: N-6 DNA methylase [Candidatus Lokiarchaeota archaeon]|nr:N-6 DNA methylase [Candidatus Lokiarchaeota archaeon]